MNGKQLISIVILFSVSVSLTSVEAASASVSVVASNGQLTNGLCTSTTFLVMEYRELNGHGEAIVYVVDCFPIISLMECTGTRPDGINCELSGDSLTITSAGTILADFFTGEHFVGDALFLGPHAIAGVGMIKCPATNEGLPMLFVYLGQWTDTGGYAFARGGSCLTIPPFSGGVASLSGPCQGNILGNIVCPEILWEVSGEFHAYGAEGVLFPPRGL